MTKHALFIGGTSGLGRELAKEGITAGFKATIAGRKAFECELVRERQATGILLDLARPYSSPIFNAAKDGLDPFDVIVLCAGEGHQGNFMDMTRERIERLSRVHVEGPTIVLNELLGRQRHHERPCHLIVVASTTAFKIRKDEAVYGGHQAFKAQLARNLGVELPMQVPGSKVLLVNPGGMKTAFWPASVDATNFMDPRKVAHEVWQAIGSQIKNFAEMQIFRQPDGSLRVSYDAQLPS